MNDLYLALGRAIAAQCPKGFKEARLEAVPDDGAYRIVCAPAEGGEVTLALNEGGGAEIRPPLAEIRARMAAEDGRTWRSCTVTLTPGGGFALDVGYADDDGADGGLKIELR